MMEKFKGIMCKKEEACGKCHDIKEEKKAGRFDIFMTATGKKIKLGKKKTKLEEKKTKLEERWFELAAALEETKMLTIKMDELDPNVAKVMQAVLAKILKRLPTEVSEAEAARAGDRVMRGEAWTTCLSGHNLLGLKLL